MAYFRGLNINIALMSYYILNEKKPGFPAAFNGIAVFYPLTTDAAVQSEQKVLFQRLFENALNIKLENMLLEEIDTSAPAVVLKEKNKFNCCLFFGVEPSLLGFRMELPLNKFVAINNIQLLKTSSPKELIEKPELKKNLWNAIQVLK